MKIYRFHRIFFLSLLLLTLSFPAFSQTWQNYGRGTTDLVVPLGGAPVEINSICGKIINATSYTAITVRHPASRSQFQVGNYVVIINHSERDGTQNYDLIEIVSKGTATQVGPNVTYNLGLGRGLFHSWPIQPNDTAQIVKIEEYRTVRVEGALTCPQFGTYGGGVLWLLVKDTLFFGRPNFDSSDNSWIIATGKGLPGITGSFGGPPASVTGSEGSGGTQPVQNGGNATGYGIYTGGNPQFNTMGDVFATNTCSQYSRGGNGGAGSLQNYSSSTVPGNPAKELYASDVTNYLINPGNGGDGGAGGRGPSAGGYGGGGGAGYYPGTPGATLASYGPSDGSNRGGKGGTGGTGGGIIYIRAGNIIVYDTSRLNYIQSNGTIGGNGDASPGIGGKGGNAGNGGAGLCTADTIYPPGGAGYPGQGGNGGDGGGGGNGGSAGPVWVTYRNTSQLLEKNIMTIGANGGFGGQGGTRGQNGVAGSAGLPLDVCNACPTPGCLALYGYKERRWPFDCHCDMAMTTLSTMDTAVVSGTTVTFWRKGSRDTCIRTATGLTCYNNDETVEVQQSCTASGRRLVYEYRCPFQENECLTPGDWYSMTGVGQIIGDTIVAFGNSGNSYGFGVYPLGEQYKLYSDISLSTIDCTFPCEPGEDEGSGGGPRDGFDGEDGEPGDSTTAVIMKDVYPTSSPPIYGPVITGATPEEGKESRKTALVIRPNPANGMVTLQYEAAHTTTLMLNVTTAAGVTMIVKPWEVQEGTNLLQLDISLLSKGTYLVNLKDSAGTVTEKLVVD